MMIDQDPLENLLPSLIQCFSVILLGYLAVRFSLITSQSNAIGTYVTKFALPALFFRSMATIQFIDVNWMFILAVSLGKLILFLLTLLITALITRPINLGMAGILSMFITQSNDVALGYPILLSLYPDLAKYIYLFAPAQLVFINPLCFILLECHEYRSDTSLSNSSNLPIRKRILPILKNVLLNPLVFMTVIGVVFNFILSHELPIYLDKILEILADSFSGVALFYLGMNMVGKISVLTKKGIYLLVFLLLGKLIFMPFLTRELVVQILNLQAPSNQSLNYSLVAFLYGGLPTAPPVFLVANSFQVIPDLIATGLVLSTFLSGPLMFISARVITMVVASKSQFDSILKSTAVSVSVISLLGCIWVLVVFCFNRRFKTPIHKITIVYTFFVMLTCSAEVIGRAFLSGVKNQTDQRPNFRQYIQFSVFFVGCVGARLWIIILAAALMILKKKTVGCLVKCLNYFYLSGLCAPVVVTASLLIFSSKTTIKDIDPTFQYGRAQLITSLVVLSCSIVSIIVLLILEARAEHNDELINLDSRKKGINSDDISLNSNNISLSSDKNIFNYQSLSQDHYKDETSNEENQRCDEELISSENIINDDDFQINRHLILTVSLVVTMGFGLFLCLWRLIKEDLSGIYVELEFLDCVFNFGQGFILWTIFGLDFKLLGIPFKIKIMKFLNNIQEFYIPLESDLSSDVIRIRKQFIKYHLLNCHRAIAKDIRHMFKMHANVFTGKSLVNWVMKIGLSNNRVDAVAYCQALLIGRVIEHIKMNRNIVDDEESLYRFTHLAEKSLSSKINNDTNDIEDDSQN